MRGRTATVAAGVVAVAAIVGSLAVYEVVMRQSSSTPRPTPEQALPAIPADLGIHVNPVEGLRSDFMMGADVSMIREMERDGARFFSAGQPQDPLQILKDRGVNWIRLRLWNDPTDANGQPLGGGNNDLAATVAIASRAKRLGLKFLLDFHYSDWWADPGKQNMPKAWVGLGAEQLNKALYDFTANSIRELAKAGAMPDMVQIGNELNNGMMWPAGQITGTGTEEVGGWDGLAALLKSGIKAVHDADPNGQDPAKRARIVIHLANGGDNSLYSLFFGAIIKRGVDFDVIGLSYYPYWHGPLADLEANMNDISGRFGKDVVVAETAYAYTLDDTDLFDNLFGASQERQGGYKATVQGQATAVRSVIAAVAQVPDKRGLGIFYWEPDWYSLKGAGWKTGEGNEWENQAMFDDHGEALPSMYVFRLANPASGSATVPATVTAIDPIDVKTGLGALPTLPDTVEATFSDDSVMATPVTWQLPDVSAFAKAGAVTVEGTVAGSSIKAIANLTVTGNLNLVVNPGFETGALDPWTTTDPSANVSKETGNPHSGTYAGHYWSDKPFTATLSQTITGLGSGTYLLSAWAQGGGGEKTLQLFATCGDKTLTADIANKGWQQWTQPTIRGINVSGGSCTIGLKVDAPAGVWGFIDDFELTKEQ